MKLSAKQMAVFGRTIVDTQSAVNTGGFYRTTDLLTLYNEGWWVTERFGNTICICRKKRNISRTEFISRFRLFRTEIKLESFDALWKPIAEQQFKKYKKVLLEQKGNIYV